MEKKAFFFIDDVIWVFRDLTRKRPDSIFDNPFLHDLKTAHDRYGLKVQLNVFYQTDFFYGNDEFTLADMTDAYKEEWEEASDWLKFGFHAKQEFPDYPYINADYRDVKENFDAIQKEVFRFAGEKSFAYAVVTHWLPMSKEGCQALKDSGIKIMSVTSGEKIEYNGDRSVLPYGHAFRLEQNRKPETGIFIRKTNDTAITSSLCGYNHVFDKEINETEGKLKAILDVETGMYFKKFCSGHILNLIDKENIEAEFLPYLEKEYIGYATHEQYFYSDYYGFQPDFMEKIFVSADLLAKNGYTHFFAEEMV
ncbi:MAG: hypothetical protein IKK59_01755 [Lachnospiraceae bacterium]|nr:hypothetical protein [Lachnospiraceae bacterium]